jgi:O-antigen/teichoic acid export membrane protein
MLVRHIIGYAPSLLVPMLASFGAVFCYTRLLSPAEFGNYGLSITTMNILVAVFFYWLQVSLPRLMPQAIKDGRAQQFRATTYVAYLAVSILLLAVAAFAINFLPLGDYYPIAWLAVFMCLARALLNMNQAFHRSYLNFNRYNLIECGQAALGLGLGLGFVWFLHLGNFGAVTGMILGMVIMVLVDARTILTTPLSQYQRDILKDIIRFGTPLVVTFGIGLVVSSSDRFLIVKFQGPAELGIYYAGYTAVDRIITILGNMIATPSFPLTIHRLEHEGVEAARDQTYKNGVAFLILGLPACAGLVMINTALANVFIGPDFRAGAAQIMPWIAVASMLNGLSCHYFSYSFHIVKKPYMLVFTQGPAAVLNLILNLLLIPKCGYMGAAYAALASYILMLALTIWLGHRAFPIKFPFKPALQIAGSVALFVIVLKMIPFSDDLMGLRRRSFDL